MMFIDRRTRALESYNLGAGKEGNWAAGGWAGKKGDRAGYE